VDATTIQRLHSTLGSPRVIVLNESIVESLFLKVSQCSLIDSIGFVFPSQNALIIINSQQRSIGNSQQCGHVHVGGE